MEIKDIEDTLTAVKWIYPIVSGCFIVIVSLLIYIWKNNVNRTDVIMTTLTEAVIELKEIQAIHGTKIETNFQEIEKLRS